MNKKNYVLVTAAYWGFTLTDGALRMLVLLHFHERGLNPIQLAFLFLLYEFCGILTNLFGGWLASNKGLKITLTSGLSLQIISLILLSLVNPNWGLWLAVGYIMGTQALSGVAKDLTKMSSKSAVRVLLPKEDPETHSGLFRWVAILTGSKNARATSIAMRNLNSGAGWTCLRAVLALSCADSVWRTDFVLHACSCIQFPMYGTRI